MILLLRWTDQDIYANAVHNGGGRSCAYGNAHHRRFYRNNSIRSGLFCRTCRVSEYGKRDYASDLGRWGSRDPIGEEAGGVNLLGFVHNNPLNKFDVLGLHGNPVTGPGGITFPADPYFGHGTTCCKCLRGSIRVASTPTSPVVVSKDVDNRMIYVGAPIEVGFTVEGSLGFCQFFHTDVSGTIVSTYQSSTGPLQTYTESIPFPRMRPVIGPTWSDYPGPRFGPMRDWTGSATGTVRYQNLVITATCVGTDGITLEKTLTLNNTPSQPSFPWAVSLP
jgi:RHS repeat-associated protein